MSKYIDNKLVVAILYPIFIVVNQYLGNKFTDDQLMYVAGVFATFILTKFGFDVMVERRRIQEIVLAEKKMDEFSTDNIADVNLVTTGNVTLDHFKETLDKHVQEMISKGFLIPGCINGCDENCNCAQERSCR